MTSVVFAKLETKGGGGGQSDPLYLLNGKGIKMKLSIHIVFHKTVKQNS